MSGGSPYTFKCISFSQIKVMVWLKPVFCLYNRKIYFIVAKTKTFN